MDTPEISSPAQTPSPWMSCGCGHAPLENVGHPNGQGACQMPSCRCEVYRPQTARQIVRRVSKEQLYYFYSQAPTFGTGRFYDDNRALRDAADKELTRRAQKSGRAKGRRTVARLERQVRAEAPLGYCTVRTINEAFCGLPAVEVHPSGKPVCEGHRYFMA